MNKINYWIAGYAARWLYRHNYSVVVNVCAIGFLKMTKPASFYEGVVLDHPVILSNGKKFVFPTTGRFHMKYYDSQHKEEKHD